MGDVPMSRPTPSEQTFHVLSNTAVAQGRRAGLLD